LPTAEVKPDWVTRLEVWRRRNQREFSAWMQRRATGMGMMARLYWHFQFGKRTPYHINANSLDFSAFSQKMLGMPPNMEVGYVHSANLLGTGIINEVSLSFGKIKLTYLGDNQFSISDRFDFNHEPNGSFGRNALTLFGGWIFGRVYNDPAPFFSPFALPVQPNYFLGGPFPIIFNGTITIKP
jgi:hypothetical protein